jgi:peptide-methionine (S)-S-oxide reductase
MLHRLLNSVRATIATPALAVALLLVPGPGASPKDAVAIFAGGCYWTVEAIFEHVKGVESAVSGLATPATDSSVAWTRPPRLNSLAEAVQVTYDPGKVSYEELLEAFFRAAHDPTQLDRQGPDRGPRYRSIVFVETEAQAATVRAFIDSLGKSGLYPRPIVTEVLRLDAFKEVSEDQQDFVVKNPRHPYVLVHDRPRLASLERNFGHLYAD